MHADCAPISPPVLTGDTDYPLLARRLDLDGPGAEASLSPGQSLTPGPLEFIVRPGPSHYLVSIQNDGEKSPPPAAIDGWFAFDIGNAPRLRITLSAKPASVSGLVTSASQPIIGAPVFPWTSSIRRYPRTRPCNPPDSAEPTRRETSPSWASRWQRRLMSGYDVDFDDPLARSKAAMLTLHEGDVVTQPLEMIRQ